MDAKIEEIKVTRLTKRLLEVLAKSSDYDSIGEYLEAITSDPILCIIIKEYLEHQEEEEENAL